MCFDIPKINLHLMTSLASQILPFAIINITDLQKGLDVLKINSFWLEITFDTKTTDINIFSDYETFTLFRKQLYLYVKGT